MSKRVQFFYRKIFMSSYVTSNLSKVFIRYWKVLLFRLQRKLNMTNLVNVKQNSPLVSHNWHRHPCINRSAFFFFFLFFSLLSLTKELLANPCQSWSPHPAANRGRPALAFWLARVSWRSLLDLVGKKRKINKVENYKKNWSHQPQPLYIALLVSTSVISD